jgi:hypothetical protein
MANDIDSPSWQIYLDFFRRQSDGQHPKHLYDGYQGPPLTVEMLGPFSSKPSNGKFDVSAINTQIPSYVKLVSPIQAEVERVKDSRHQEVLEKRKDLVMTLEGVVHDSNDNPHLDPRSSKDFKEDISSPRKNFIPRKGKQLSLSEIRGKLMQSTAWQKKQRSK